MSDPTTLSVLADVAAWIIVALLLGAGAYQAMRALRPGLGWNERGQVMVMAYRAADACLVLMLAWLVWSALDAQVGAAQLPGDAALAKPEEQPASVSVLATVLFLLLVCVGLLFYLRQVRGLDPAELFGLRRLSWWRALGVALLALPITLVVVIPSNLLFVEWLKPIWPDLQPQDSVKLFLENGWLDKLAMAGAAVVVAPLVEETVFRGFVYAVLKKHTDAFFAGLVSAALFALAHAHLPSAVPLFVLALGFTVAYERTGSLLVPILMHALFNGVTLVALLVLGEP